MQIIWIFSKTLSNCTLCLSLANPFCLTEVILKVSPYLILSYWIMECLIILHFVLYDKNVINKVKSLLQIELH